MDINYINYIIKEVLNGNKVVNYKEFCYIVEKFGQYMISGVDGSEFIICDLDGKMGICTGDRDIRIDMNVIRKMYDGKKLMMYVIFHELRHFFDIYNIVNGNIDESLIRLLKERLIDFVQDEFYGKYDAMFSSYYEDNYIVDTGEALADKYGYFNMYMYYQFIGVNLSKDELRFINVEIKDASRRYNNKKRYCSMFNSNYLDIDDIFDYVIRDNCQWLEEIPYLKKEYYIDDNNKVVRKMVK